MKRLLLFLLLFFSALSLQAQPLPDNTFRLSVSPYSIEFWGRSPAAAVVSASYYGVQAIYVHDFRKMYDKKGSIYEGSWFGIFMNPLQITLNNFQFRGGIGWFLRSFPTKNGAHLNFQLQIAYKITDTIGIKYSHISSGFQLFNNINPGLDNISLTIAI